MCSPAYCAIRQTHGCHVWAAQGLKPYCCLLYTSSPVLADAEREKRESDEAKKEEGQEKGCKIIIATLPEALEIRTDVGHGKRFGNHLQALREFIHRQAHHAANNQEKEIQRHGDAVCGPEFSGKRGDCMRKDKQDNRKQVKRRDQNQRGSRRRDLQPQKDVYKRQGERPYDA